MLLLPSVSAWTEESAAVPAQVRDYWPTDEWQVSDPEDQGLDFADLDQMDQMIEDEDIELDSIVVIKNGYIVYERYYNYWTQNMAHTIQSCTKSFMSALIGIAIDMGYIDSVNQPVLSFFPNYTIDNWDPRKENITVFHLLSMSTGLEWHEVDIPYSDPANDLFAMYDSQDMWEYVLDRPMAHDPGELWAYNSGGIELLGGIIEQTTGYGVTDFAEEFLFDPIGINSFSWWQVPANGQYGCSGGLYLKPRDMSRFGFLYLNNGTWNGTQIISSDWIRNSTQMYYQTTAWYEYGMTWWGIPGYNVYAATGHYEQKIYVLPDEDIVAVFTGDIPDNEWHPTDWFVLNCVLTPTLTVSAINPELVIGVSTILLLVIPPPVFYLRHRLRIR